MIVALARKLLIALWRMVTTVNRRRILTPYRRPKVTPA
jgi:hypothetical protein